MLARLTEALLPQTPGLSVITRHTRYNYTSYHHQPASRARAFICHPQSTPPSTIDHPLVPGYPIAIYYTRQPQLANHDFSVVHTLPASGHPITLFQTDKIEKNHRPIFYTRIIFFSSTQSLIPSSRPLFHQLHARHYGSTSSPDVIRFSICL